MDLFYFPRGNVHSLPVILSFPVVILSVFSRFSFLHLILKRLSFSRCDCVFRRGFYCVIHLSSRLSLFSVPPLSCVFCGITHPQCALLPPRVIRSSITKIFSYDCFPSHLQNANVSRYATSPLSRSFSIPWWLTPSLKPLFFLAYIFNR
jgi:hypothetical protein